LAVPTAGNQPKTALIEVKILIMRNALAVAAKPASAKRIQTALYEVNLVSGVTPFGEHCS